LKLVVDTNVLLKALIKDSRVRAILLSPGHQFVVPEYVMEEVERHLPLIMEKSGLSEREIRLALSILLTNIQVIPKEDVLAQWSEAEKIMMSIDRGDIPFIAASLSTACDGTWSDDKHLRRQNKVKVWTTEDIILRVRLG
jgi:predicted nucleic acid-binding protein